MAPVLARLCLGWSLSEGERERLRVLSASGMIREQVWSGSHSRGPQGLWGVDETEGTLGSWDEGDAWKLGQDRSRMEAYVSGATQRGR